MVKNEASFAEWLMQPVLNHIRPKLLEESMHLLTALNDPANLPAP